MTNQTTQTTSKRRGTILNKFLTKTYHMLDHCPQDIVSWSNSGDTFTVKDVDACETEVLPKYFNHSKFSSFVRQLNFYGFTKQRSDPDLQTHTKAVRFSHDCFRKGHRELLNKIQRTTASKRRGHPRDEQIEDLQQHITGLRGQLAGLEKQNEQRVERAVDSFEMAYLVRVQNLEKCYQTALATIISQFGRTPYLPVVGLSTTLDSTGNIADLA